MFELLNFNDDVAADSDVEENEKFEFQSQRVALGHLIRQIRNLILDTEEHVEGRVVDRHESHHDSTPFHRSHPQSHSFNRTHTTQGRHSPSHARSQLHAMIDSADLSLEADQAADDSCNGCPGSSDPNIEQWPHPPGAGCIGTGGCGRSTQTLRAAQPLSGVKQLQGFSDGNCINGFSVQFFDGTSFNVGNTLSSRGPSTIVFTPGETIANTYTITGNGRGQCAGSLMFTTNKGQTFNLNGNNDHNKFVFNAGNVILTALNVAYDGGTIYSLSLITSKPISSVQLMDVSYPTLSSIPFSSSPVSLFDGSLCNPAPGTGTISENYQDMVSSSTTWSDAVAVSFGMDIKVTAGFPGVVGAETSYKWSVGNTFTYSHTHSEAVTTTTSGSYTVPAYQQCTLLITQFQANIDVPYTGTLLINFEDGSSYGLPTHGQYSGVSVTSPVDSVSCHAVKTKADCVTASA